MNSTATTPAAVGEQTLLSGKVQMETLAMKAPKLVERVINTMIRGRGTGGSASRLAWIGLLGIVLFVVTIVSLHFLQADLKPLDEAMSYYVHGPHGWLLTVGLIELGIASLAITRALGKIVDGRGARSGLWLLGVWSVGVLLGGFFPADRPGHWNEPPSLAGMIHGNAALLAFTVFPVATLILGKGFHRDRRWLPTASTLRLLAVAAVISLVAFLASLTPVFIRPGPPILLGLSERVLIAVYVAWLMLVAVTILRRSLGSLEAERATHKRSQEGGVT